MQVCYFDVGIVSVYVGRRSSSVGWSKSMRPWNAELWAGKTYAVISFSEKHCRKARRAALIAGAAFAIGWLALPQPEFASANSVVIQSMDNCPVGL